MPLVRRKIQDKQDKYLNSQAVALARSLRDLAYKEYRRNPTDNNLRIFRRYRNNAKSVIRRKKKSLY